MKLQIVPDDNLFMLDGKSKKGFTFSIDSNIHAVWWNEIYGEIEYKELVVKGNLNKTPNLKIYSVEQFTSLIQSFIDFTELEEESSLYDPDVFLQIDNIEYSFKINEMKIAKSHGDKQNIVDTVAFTLKGTLGSFSDESLFHWKLSKYEQNNDFIDFSNLSETDIIQWLLDEIPAKEIERMKYVVSENISNTHYEEIVEIGKDKLPWNIIEVPEEVITVDESSNTETSNTETEL